MTAVTTQFGQRQHTAHHSSSPLRTQPRFSPSNRSSQSGTSPRAHIASVLVHGKSGAMPSAARASSGAGSLTLAAGRPESQTKSSAPRPQTENGLPRRNSTSSHKRPSSAPGDDNKPNGTNGVEQRPKVARPATLLRSRSEHPSQQPRPLRLDTSAESLADDQTIAAAEDFGTRHGFDGHYQSEDIISQLANGWYMYFTDKRHETSGKPKSEPFHIQDWRMRDRLKTVSAALAVCLNIGVEPPDQLKTNPGAKLEAWQDPTVPPVQKALENIGKALQAQYETLAIRTRYKQYLDPSVEETKKFCISLRRNAKDERVLLHYNGHGVPKPTASGEIWVFNKNYTQYIPVSLYDLQQWLSAPTIFVWDCSEAGNILNNYHRFVEKHEQEQEELAARDATYEKASFRPYIHLAACAVKENLPTNPQLPADLFTSCLTTPIEMALWFFALQNPLKSQRHITPERAKKLPGRLQERRTPLGELNWIFTAITDTIAWTTLPRHLFRKFFRQDLMVAALFRNFLLAQRIMSVYGCHPQSYPELPDTRQHPLWDSWDLAVDMALSQLPMLERKETEGIDYEYQSSTFFTDQLSAFDVYLTRGDAMSQKPPEQLPVVLQVLLSQQHRVRALILLGRFLDLGPWAVQLSLSIGIFPYVLKLLQSTHAELKPVMVYIWTRVLAVDISCQQDLIKDSGYNYFAQILKPSEVLVVTNSDEHKAMCAFILAMLCKDYKPGQVVCNQTEIMSYCLLYLQNEDNPLLRQWSCLCLSQLWLNMPEAKWRGIRENAPTKLSALTKDQCCEVRAAMLVAMTTFIGIPDLTAEVQRIEEAIAWTLLDMSSDGSPMVRRELLVFLSHFILRYESKFVVAAYEHLLEEKEYLLFPPKDDVFDRQNMLLHYTRPANREDDGSIKPQAEGLSNNTVIAAAWKHIMIMSADPHPEVQKDATIVTDYVHHSLLYSAVGAQAQNLMEEIQRRTKHTFMRSHTSHHRSNTSLSMVSDTSASQSPGLLKRTFTTLLGPWAGADSSTNMSPIPSQPASKSGSLRNRTGLPDAPPEQQEQFMAPANYHIAEEPVSAGYEERNMKVVPTLPLPSGFLDWSIEYFREPQMKPNEAEEPGSEEYNARLWRRSRNEGILRDTQPQKSYAGSHKWNQQIALINNGAQPAKMTFHQFEDHLAVADDANTVYVWDWKLQKRRSRFSNGNPEGSKISDIKFINEDDQAFLLSGSSDGVIRIYRNYAPEDDEVHLKKPELASSWRALTHMVASNVNSGMVFDWLQVNGTVLVAGDVRVIRVWNASSETCLMDIPARSGSCVTSLTSDQMTGNIFVAGFGDGAVRVFDQRMKPQEAMVRKWKDEPDRQWIRSVHMQRGGQRELVSASRNGKVRLWDIRMDQPLKVFQTTKDVLRTASVHEHLPVFSVGTSTHAVKVFNFHGRELSRVEPYSSFLGQNRGSPISATAFHPHRMIMGAAARGDHHVNIFTCTNEPVLGSYP